MARHDHDHDHDVSYSYDTSSMQMIHPRGYQKRSTFSDVFCMKRVKCYDTCKVVPELDWLP